MTPPNDVPVGHHRLVETGIGNINLASAIDAGAMIMRRSRGQRQPRCNVFRIVTVVSCTGRDG